MNTRYLGRGVADNVVIDMRRFLAVFEPSTLRLKTIRVILHVREDEVETLKRELSATYPGCSIVEDTERPFRAMLLSRPKRLKTGPSRR